MRFRLLACLVCIPVCFFSQVFGTEDSVQVDRVQESVHGLLYDAKSLPRLHFYNEEETALLSSSSKTVVMKADGGFTRNLYDQEYRLKSRITWQEEVSSTDATTSPLSAQIVLQEDYFYYENSRNRQRVVVTDFTDTSRTERFYSQEGLITREEVYGPHSQQDENPQDENPQGADDFSQLSLKQVTEYFYSPEKGLTEKKVVHHGEGEAFVQKTKYHSPGNLYGGYDYFENEVLVVSRTYQDESVYTEIRYFDNMKIEARYTGARLLAEVVYLDGKEIRRTEY